MKLSLNERIRILKKIAADIPLTSKEFLEEITFTKEELENLSTKTYTIESKAVVKNDSFEEWLFKIDFDDIAKKRQSIMTDYAIDNIKIRILMPKNCMIYGCPVEWKEEE